MLGAHHRTVRRTLRFALQPHNSNPFQLSVASLEPRLINHRPFPMPVNYGAPATQPKRPTFPDERGCLPVRPSTPSALCAPPHYPTTTLTLDKHTELNTPPDNTHILARSHGAQRPAPRARSEAERPSPEGAHWALLLYVEHLLYSTYFIVCHLHIIGRWFLFNKVCQKLDCLVGLITG